MYKFTPPKDWKLNKAILSAVLLAGCGVPNKAQEAANRQMVENYTAFQVRCPLNTIESTTDTIKARTYYYTEALNFYRASPLPYKQFPATCVVKEITE